MRRLLVSFIVFFTLIFSYTILAQEMGSFRRNIEKEIPVKLMKPTGTPLATGTYTIGSGGDFPTIDSAFNKLSVDGIAGEVTLELIDDLYTAPTDDYGFLLNGPIPGADQNNRVSIKPAANKNVIVEGNGEAVITFLNTSHLTLDGTSLTGSATLTFHALYNNQFIWNDCVHFLDNSDHNLIQNIIFISEDNNRACAGLVLYTSWNVGISAPDSNSVKNNFVKKAGFGIVIQGSVNTRVIGNIIKENIIGSESDSLISVGIHILKSQNSIVENNIVQNLKVSGIIPSDDLVMGINSYWSSGDIIRKNVVHNLKSSSGYTSVGILLSGSIGEEGNNNLVCNNMVYDIQSTSTAFNNRVTGIQIWNQNNPKIYYNSIYLSGTGANKSGSAAFYITYNCTNVEAKNNILLNTRDESPYCASAAYDYTTTNLISDYNDLFYDNTNPNNCLVRIGSTNYNTLANWQATGKDLHSITEMPNFMEAEDLHQNSGFLSNIESRGTPIAGIDTDFDGDARDSQHPDIGADEFEGQTRIFSQESWTKYGSPVLLSGSAGEWDDDGLGMPCVIYDGTTYKIWYSGFDGTTWRIGYATSPDGINWTKYNDPSTINPPYAESDPVLNLGPAPWEGVWVYAPFVHFDGTTYHMWYAGTDGYHDRVGYATSPDGITWTKNPDPVINLGPSGSWDDASVDPGPISVERGNFLMMYNGYDGLHYQGGYAASNDGINWAKSADPVISYGAVGRWDNPRVQPNSVVYDDSTSKYYLFYSGGALLNWRIGYAISNAFNGPWIKDPSIMLDVTPGSWDSDVVAFPYVIDDPVNNLYKMWYLGGSSGSVGAIGYATTRRYPVAVEDEIRIPENYFLEQNYPNPFNPSTTFRYSIPNSSIVTIKIYDVLGTEIEILVSEEKPVGTYELTWNAANLPSGVYFYRLQAGDFVQTRKMILLK